MIDIDDRAIRRLESDLKTFAAKALPFATRNTLNQGAFQAQRFAKENIREDMTTRNRFTEQSVRVVQERRELNIRRQQATVGSIADYMETQEFGGQEVKTGKHGVAIATSYSAGQEGAQPRTRLPRKANKMQNIMLQRRRVRGGRKQRNLVAVRQAATTGRKFVFLDLGRRQGIFRVTGGKRRPKLKMVHDLTRKSVVIPKQPWLAPAVKRTEAKMPEFYRKSLEFQARRQGILGR